MTERLLMHKKTKEPTFPRFFLCFLQPNLYPRYVPASCPASNRRWIGVHRLFFGFPLRAETAPHSRDRPQDKGNVVGEEAP